MKICILTTGHNALDDRIFYKQALSLKEISDDITIIAPDLKESYEVDGIKIIGVTKPESLLDRFRIMDELIDKAIEQKADIYHFHDYEIILKTLKIKKKLPKAKIIYDVHEHYPDMVRMSKKLPKAIKPFVALAVDLVEKMKTKKFDYIITADDAVKERLEKLNKNIEVIYNFSDFKVKKEDKVEKNYDVIYQGGITIERGVFELVKAVEIVKNSYKKDVSMVFVGPISDKEVEEKVLPYIEAHNLQENVKFLGKVPHVEVEGYIRKSKIGAVTLLPYPKYFKNIPIKQFEYMSCGVPVIGSDLPPIKKFVSKYNAGLIVNPQDVEDIAKAIMKLLDNDELRNEMGSNGMLAVEKEYNWSQMHGRLINIYKSIANKTN
ncbi:MAG: glycosyltransferase family 4 protein [Clostridiales bacterium]|nr:glycosyltransferase family 4 protein [Clostridiales bacterium]